MKDPPRVILHYNLQSLSPDLQHIWGLIFIIWLLRCLQMPPLYPLGPTLPDTTIKPFTHSWLDAMRTRLCALLRLRCLAQGRCGVVVAGMVPLGIQEPRHVFRPPAGKYTFNATESPGGGRREKNTRSPQEFYFKAATVWGTAGKIFNVSTGRVLTASHYVKANTEDRSGVKSQHPILQ